MDINSVAFCASTLPFQQIIRNYQELRIDEVVCASEALGVSYKKGFNQVGLRMLVGVASGNRIVRNMKLLRYLLKNKQVVIFHECSWPDLDLLILFLRINTVFLPSVTLASRTCVKIQDIPLRHRLFAVLTYRWFDFYKTDDDNGGVYYTPSIKPQFRKATSLSIACKRNCELTKLVTKPSARVLILIGTDIVPNSVLKKLYDRIVLELKLISIEVHLKDHPNPAARLGMLSEKAFQIDSDLPLECLDLTQYCAFISVASTGLAAGAESGKIISIGNLLPPEYCDKIKRRLAHLHSIGVHPDLPNCIEELIDIIRENCR